MVMRSIKMLSVNVDIDQEDVIDMISDEDLVKELGLRNAGRTHLATVREAIDLINAGDTDEAILRLEREFWPKWKSEGDSHTAYSAATAHNDNKEAALGAVA